MIVNTLIGLIAISIAVSIVYCIGRICIRIMPPETLHPDIKNPWTAAAIGGMFLCILSIMVVVCSTLGHVVVRVLSE
jgi:Na+-transporting methylmalonyl-CoA/oxaloacetate decarboxylase gamma subunit